MADESEGNNVPSTSTGGMQDNTVDTLSDYLGGLRLSDNPSEIEEFFPRCEYKHRMKGTSAFSMSESECWGSYFRSTSRGGNCDRIAMKYKSKKTYQNQSINDPGPAAKAGTFHSPWEHDEYKGIFYKKKEKPSALYDDLLIYKMHFCEEVVENFQKSTEKSGNMHMNVYTANDYPCIMVQIVWKNKREGEQSSMYNIILSYFTAITNNVALHKKVPVELVLRSSFGHNVPSVAETFETFRINPGIVPTIYAEVLAESLILLNSHFLSPLFEGQFKLNLSTKYINELNDEIEAYNSNKTRQSLNKQRSKDTRTKKSASVNKWEENENLYDVLLKTGDSSGKKVSSQITRKNCYIDLLCDFVSEELSKANLIQDSVTINLAIPLIRMLKKLKYKNTEGEYEATLDTSDDDYKNSKYQTSFEKSEHDSIKRDQKFWELVNKIPVALKTEKIDSNLNSKMITGFYSRLEEANLEFVRSSEDPYSEDGYGSDSGCEAEIEGIKFYSAKIMVSTGIRAINVAQLLSQTIAPKKKINTEFMYYETAKAIGGVRSDLDKVDLGVSEQTDIIYIDLNFCPYKKKVVVKKINAKPNEKVRIFDYTSATTKKIGEAIKIVKEVPTLLLVSSGIKNEQIGADMNPYGTVRIISQDEITVNVLYSYAKQCLGTELLPKEAHNIRRSYKKAGAVVTSKAIFSEANGYSSYKPKMLDSSKYHYLVNRTFYKIKTTVFSVLSYLFGKSETIDSSTENQEADQERANFEETDLAICERNSDESMSDVREDLASE